MGWKNYKCKGAVRHGGCTMFVLLPTHTMVGADKRSHRLLSWSLFMGPSGLVTGATNGKKVVPDKEIDTLKQLGGESSPW